MQNILLLTDFSNDAYNALYFVSRLFKSKKCNFVLLNAFGEHTTLDGKAGFIGDRENIQGRDKDSSCEALKQMFHRINLDHKCPNHHYELISMNMELTNAISEAIDTHSIDLIVMGNKGATAKKGVFLGSSTTKVMASIKKCPILAIPMESEFMVPYEIAFATNYKNQYDAQLLNPLCKLAQICGAAIRIVHIKEEEHLSKEQESNLHALQAHLKALENTVHWMPNFTNKSKAIQVFLDELGIKMLAMVYTEHGFLENLFREPVIKKLTFKLNIPFLVIPNTN